MRFRTLVSLLPACLPLVGPTSIGVAQTSYHPLEVGKKTDATRTKPVKLTAWTAKPGTTTRLDSEKSLFGWSIRPPRGFVSTQRSENLNQIFIFQGDLRPDGTYPALWIILGDVRQGDPKQSKDEVVMDQYAIELHKNRTDWKATPTQYGSIQGRKFLRRRWSAAQTIDGVSRRMHGTIYVTLFGTKFAALTIQDADPGAASTIGLMETSALTFRKR